MKLFEPLDINGMVIQNRTLVPAMVTRLSGEDGYVNQAIIDRLGLLQPLTSDFGEPEDVAAAALYLASDESRFVTGTVLTVDGGWTTR